MEAEELGPDTEEPAAGEAAEATARRGRARGTAGLSRPAAFGGAPLGQGEATARPALNFFLADVRDGLGPYLAIYLLDRASTGTRPRSGS